MYFGFFQIPTTMNFYQEIWHESLFLCTKVFVALLLFTTTVVNLGFEFFQVSWCLDLGLNHFATFLIQSWKALNLWKFHLGRSGLKMWWELSILWSQGEGSVCFCLKTTSGNTCRHMYKQELHNMTLEKHTLLHAYYCCSPHQTWVQFCNTSRQVGAGREVCDIWHQSATTALGCSLLHGKHEYHQ